jgi:hypothetical protein
MVVRRWDIGNGRPVPVPAAQRAREVLAVRVLDPFAVNPVEVKTGVWSFSVFGLDPRCKLVVTAFFRRSEWYADRKADGTYDPDNTLAGTDGEGYVSATVKAVVVRRDALGPAHDIGELPADVFLNGGVLPDGCEIATAADGVRVEVACEMVTAPTSDTVCSWDIVCAVEVVPDEVLGCSGLADEIIGAIEVRIDPTVLLTSNWVGEE